MPLVDHVVFRSLVHALQESKCYFQIRIQKHIMLLCANAKFNLLYDDIAIRVVFVLYCVCMCHFIFEKYIINQYELERKKSIYTYHWN